LLDCGPLRKCRDFDTSFDTFRASTTLSEASAANYEPQLVSFVRSGRDGGAGAPTLFGNLIEFNSRTPLFWGYIGAPTGARRIPVPSIIRVKCIPRSLYAVRVWHASCTGYIGKGRITWKIWLLVQPVFQWFVQPKGMHRAERSSSSDSGRRFVFELIQFVLGRPKQATQI
jgi:hypothetical protein